MKVDAHGSMRFTTKKLAASAGLLWLVAALLACGLEAEIVLPEETPMPEKTIQQVLIDHTDSLMALPGVVGIAQGECSGQPCIRVFAAKKTAELLKLVPKVIEGYEVAVDETGEFKALEEED